MKKVLFLTFLLGIFCQALNSQTASNSYFVSSNTHSLIDSYRDLLTQTNVKSCTYDNTSTGTSGVKGSYYCDYSAMSAKGYNSGVAGFVSFSSWYWYVHTDPKNTIPFHTAWFSSQTQANAVLCPDCWPKPIVNPFPATANMDNHVFEVVLVPVAAYQQKNLRATKFSHGGDATDPFVGIEIKATDVKKIYEITVEGYGGYMSKNVSAAYNNLYSSVGIICEVLLKNGTVLKCYVFNNYDGGTMVWKGTKN